MGRRAQRARRGAGRQAGDCRIWVAPVLGQTTAGGGPMDHAEMPAWKSALAWQVQAAELGCPALLLRDNPVASERGAGEDYGHHPKC